MRRASLIFTLILGFMLSSSVAFAEFYVIPVKKKNYAPVEKTGQTPTDPIPAPPGSDGAFQKGVGWPVPRFTDNNDGTVTDNLTGLIWLKDANCFGFRSWSQALSDCAGLTNDECGLTDGSDPGDWRLPNIKELLSLIDYAYETPALSNGLGTGPWDWDDPFIDVQSFLYWTSSTTPNPTYKSSHAYYVGLTWGYVGIYEKENFQGLYVWPVRGKK